MHNEVTAVAAVKELLVTITGTYLLNKLPVAFPIQKFITTLQKQETAPFLTQINSFHIRKTDMLMIHFNIIPNI
jgi:hypothetical protein